jgi:DNA-binding NtrC family response regulator
LPSSGQSATDKLLAGALTRMRASILIVEDEAPLTELLRYNLEAAGYQVEIVPRGDDADS